MQDNTYSKMEHVLGKNTDINADINLLQELRELLKNYRNDSLHDYAPREHKLKLMQGINSILDKCTIDKDFICKFMDYFKLNDLNVVVNNNKLTLLRAFLVCAKADIVEVLLKMGVSTNYDQYGQSPLIELLENSELNLKDQTTYDNVKKIICLFRDRNLDFSKVVNRREIIPESLKQNSVIKFADEYRTTRNILECCTSELKDGLQQILSELNIPLEPGHKQEYNYNENHELVLTKDSFHSKR